MARNTQVLFYIAAAKYVPINNACRSVQIYGNERIAWSIFYTCVTLLLGPIANFPHFHWMEIFGMIIDKAESWFK